jgi:hypothetical protein
MCQLEGSDHGGRDSAAELALAGGIDVNVGRLLQPADFGVSPTRRGNYTPRKLSVNGFLQKHVTYFTPLQSRRVLGAESASLLAFDTLPCGFYTADSSNAMAR